MKFARIFLPKNKESREEIVIFHVKGNNQSLFWSINRIYPTLPTKLVSSKASRNVSSVFCIRSALFVYLF